MSWFSVYYSSLRLSISGSTSKVSDFTERDYHSNHDHLITLLRRGQNTFVATIADITPVTPHVED